MGARRMRVGVVVLAAMAGIGGTGWGYLVGLETEEKLAGDVEAYLKAHPRSAEAHFCLGRVHMTAWAYREKKDWRMEYAGRGDDGLPRFPPWGTVMLRRSGDEPAGPGGPQMMGRPAGAVTAEAVRSLVLALPAYRKAVELDGNNARYRLALGCSLEEMGRAGAKLPEEFAWGELTAEEKGRCGAAIAKLGAEEAAVREEGSRALLALMPAAGRELVKVKSDDPEVIGRVDGILRKYWHMQAVGEYRKAYAAAVEKDLAAKQWDPLEDATISQEAGRRLMVLLQALPEMQEKGELAELEKAVKLIEKKPQKSYVF